ncbi:MAG: neutral/alkaline non-lysosomal ceramidase N-terminal domain-containing protein [Dehalococcoidia bacterium]
MPDLLAGAATADITPAPGGLMDGYGSRSSPSQGVHDPLTARVLVLEQGAETAAIVSCDLLGMHPWIAAEVRRRAAEAHGISPDGVVVAATHSHAGPVGLRAGMFAHLDKTLAQTLVDQVCGALAQAWESRRPATLGIASATVDTISMNRRDPAGPNDTELRVVLLDSVDGPIASIVNFACHATVLTGANLLLSGEFPAAAARLLQRETGAPCIYLNGACGDVNPAWITQDYPSVERAGQIVGGHALRLIAEMRALVPGQRTHNVRWNEFPDVAPLGRAVVPSLRAVRREVDIPPRDFEDDDAYAKRLDDARAVVERTPTGSAERRAAAALISRYEAERWSAVWSRRSPTAARTEVQALRLGDDLALLALPGEFFAETAAHIREATGAGDLLVACYANDYVGYVVPADAYAEGGHEPGLTFFAPEADAIIRRAAVDLLQGVTSG